MHDLEKQKSHQTNDSLVELNEHDMDKIIGGKKKHKSHGDGGEEGGGDGSNPTWSDRYHTNRQNGQNVPRSAWNATINP